MFSQTLAQCVWEQQGRNKIIKDKGEEGKKKGMNVERSTVATKKSRQPKRQKSRQSLTTARQEAPEIFPFIVEGKIKIKIPE